MGQVQEIDTSLNTGQVQEIDTFLNMGHLQEIKDERIIHQSVLKAS